MSQKADVSLKENDAKESALESSFLAIVAATFTTVFLAELGDKTQIATLLLSAQSGNIFLVFAGAAIALICSSLVGVLIGKWIAQNLSKDRFNQMAGILMTGLGLIMGTQATLALLDISK